MFNSQAHFFIFPVTCCASPPRDKRGFAPATRDSSSGPDLLFFRPAVNNGGLPEIHFTACPVPSPRLVLLWRVQHGCQQPQAVSGKTRPVSSRVRPPACPLTRFQPERVGQTRGFVPTLSLTCVINRGKKTTTTTATLQPFIFQPEPVCFPVLRSRRSLSAASTLHRKYYISPVEFFYSAEVKTLPSGCLRLPRVKH